jgi:trigger factor
VKSSIEALEGNKVKVHVEVDEDEFETAVDQAFRAIAKEVRIPGFRPGKAPRKVLEARLGKDVARGQALQDAIPGYYGDAVREHDVDVIAPPEIDITDGQESGPVVFDATVEVRPVITVSGYESLQVTIDSPVPSDDDIDAQVERLRAAYAELATVERAAADDDVVVIDIAGTVDGEPLPGLTADDYSYNLGSGAIVEELDEQLRGSQAGAVLEFDAAHPVQEDVRIDFRVEVKEVKEKVLPDLDDDFAAQASEFATMAEMRDDLVVRATRVRKTQAQMALREATGEAVAELVLDDVPDALVSAEMQERLQDLSMRLQAQGMNLETWLGMQGTEPDAFVEDLRTAAATAAKVDLALRAVAEAEGIEATDEDLEEEYAGVAQRVDASVEDVRAQFERNDQVSAIRSDIRKRKAFEWLLERAEVVDREGAPIDRDSLEIDDEDDDATAEADASGDVADAGDDHPQDDDDEESE